MNVTFLFGTIFGRGDSTEWEADVEITEEEYKRIEDACREGNDFCDSESVDDIYNRLLDIASEGLDGDSYAIVYYPVGMEERIWEEEEEEEEEDEEE